MSHFTVTVRLTAERLAKHGTVARALDEIMAPFYEGTTDERFITFEDEEDEMREKYLAGSTERVRMPDGRLLLPWDDAFRVAGSFGMGGGTHEPPKHLERVTVPFSETFATFEEYATGWHGGAKPDPKTGRYGHWRNPSAKWDWFVIGGRWSGHFPLKPGAKRQLGKAGTFDNKPEAGKGDVVRVTDIDLDACLEEQMRDQKKFWAEWQELLGGREFDAFEGPRDRALRMGLLRVEQKPVVAGPKERVFSWETKVKDDRRHWSDVATILTEDEFFTPFADHFDPLATFAGLDDAGWTEPGRMGWFACSSDTPETLAAFRRAFRERFITACEAADKLVLVDCHI